MALRIFSGLVLARPKQSLEIGVLGRSADMYDRGAAHLPWLEAQHTVTASG